MHQHLQNGDLGCQPQIHSPLRQCADCGAAVMQWAGLMQQRVGGLQLGLRAGWLLKHALSHLIVSGNTLVASRTFTPALSSPSVRIEGQALARFSRWRPATRIGRLGPGSRARRRPMIPADPAVVPGSGQWGFCEGAAAAV